MFSYSLFPGMRGYFLLSYCIVGSLSRQVNFYSFCFMHLFDDCVVVNCRRVEEHPCRMVNRVRGLRNASSSNVCGHFLILEWLELLKNGLLERQKSGYGVNFVCSTWVIYKPYSKNIFRNHLLYFGFMVCILSFLLVW